jgi:hypothetical protein
MPGHAQGSALRRYPSFLAHCWMRCRVLLRAGTRASNAAPVMCEHFTGQASSPRDEVHGKVQPSAVIWCNTGDSCGGTWGAKRLQGSNDARARMALRACLTAQNPSHLYLYSHRPLALRLSIAVVVAVSRRAELPAAASLPTFSPRPPAGPKQLPRAITQQLWSSSLVAGVVHHHQTPRHLK